MNMRSLFVLAGSAVLVAACGDSSVAVMDPPPVVQPSNEVPTSATASTTAYVQYTGSLAASDTNEPLLVDKVVPPTSETEEPQTV